MATARDALPRQARLVGALALWQFASGLSNVVLDWPLVAALAHTAGAAALVVVLTWALCEASDLRLRRPRPRGRCTRGPGHDAASPSSTR